MKFAKEFENRTGPCDFKIRKPSSTAEERETEEKFSN